MTVLGADVDPERAEDAERAGAKVVSLAELLKRPTLSPSTVR